MPKGAGHDVVCPGCAESYHITTSKYTPNRDANAGMLKLKRQYTAAEGNQWDDVPPDPTAGYGLLECPGCGAMLAPSGRLTVKDKAEVNKKVYVCEVCGEEFEKPVEKAIHMRKTGHSKMKGKANG